MTPRDRVAHMIGTLIMQNEEKDGRILELEAQVKALQEKVSGLETPKSS